MDKVNNRTKICLVIHSLGIGGMERVMSLLANNFISNRKVDVHLVLIGRERDIKYPIHSDIKVHRPNFEFNNQKRFLHTLKTIQFLRSKIKSLKPDTILSFGEYWNNLTLLSLIGVKFPIFVADRSEPGKDLGKTQNFLRNRLYPMATGYVAQTIQAESVCRRNKWNDNIRVIGNPIREMPNNDYTSNRKKVVLFVGRLIKTKNVDSLIRIFDEVRKPGWSLKIVGGDARGLLLSEEYKKIIKNLGAEKYISLEGEREDVDRYYKSSEIFAFPSVSEGFPNAVGEALSAGLPVVGYDDVAGVTDLIEDGRNGYLVPKHNETEFKNKLEVLMKNEIQRKQMRIQTKNVSEKFNLNCIADKFYEFITMKRA